MMLDSLGKMMFRPAWATVDLPALSRNFDIIKRLLPSGAGVLAMVKADAYGHGAREISLALERAGARALGVATVEEGIELREFGIRIPILVMSGLMGEGSAASFPMVDANLTPVVHSSGVLDSLEEAAVKAGRTVDVHLKIDSGMSRLGVRPESLPGVIEKLRRCPHLRVEGAMTHLADAGDEDFSSRQLDLFLTCKARIEGALGPVPVWHAANSVAIMRGEALDFPDAGETWVRPGLALFGDCGFDHRLREKLSLVMGIESRVMLIKHVPAGAMVSYGCTFKARRPSRLAIVPIGYADGYPWSVSGKARVLVRGRRAPVAGRVTMDMIVLDVTDVEGVSVGDEVVLMGSQGDEFIGLDELAGWAGTIPYEIICGVSKRMPRIYKRD
ncbi:MAG: alanine racemase [Proteobacteria bacterium]|nr:alanine racemase [Pseudomonadota bacterium]